MSCLRKFCLLLFRDDKEFPPIIFEGDNWHKKICHHFRGDNFVPYHLEATICFKQILCYLEGDMFTKEGIGGDQLLNGVWLRILNLISDTTLFISHCSILFCNQLFSSDLNKIIERGVRRDSFPPGLFFRIGGRFLISSDDPDQEGAALYSFLNVLTLSALLFHKRLTLNWIVFHSFYSYELTLPLTAFLIHCTEILWS